MPFKEMTNEEYAQLEDKLRPKLTDEFLASLAEAAQTFGNSGDWPAVKEFVEWIYDTAGKDRPTLKPCNVE